MTARVRCRTCQDAHEAVLRDGTGRPASRLMVRKPVVRHLVMRVLWIEERDQQIDVEERDAAHSSSLSSFTSFIVMIRPPGRRGSNGTPLRTFGVGPVGVSALRARLESIFPAVTRYTSASSLAACKHILIEV